MPLFECKKHWKQVDSEIAICTTLQTTSTTRPTATGITFTSANPYWNIGYDLNSLTQWDDGSSFATTRSSLSSAIINFDKDIYFPSYSFSLTGTRSTGGGGLWSAYQVGFVFFSGLNGTGEQCYVSVTGNSGTYSHTGTIDQKMKIRSCCAIVKQGCELSGGTTKVSQTITGNNFKITSYKLWV